MGARNLTEEFIKVRNEIIESQYKHLNHNQRRAVLSGEGPQMVIAGPGSGKTHVIMHRLHYLITYGLSYNTKKVPPGITQDNIGKIKEDSKSPIANGLLNYYGIDSRSILVITFTKVAADEMKLRFAKMFKDENPRGKNITFGTFHSVFFRIIRSACGYLVEQVLREDEKRFILKKIVEELEIEYEDEQEFLGELQNEISLIKNDLIDLTYYNSMVLPSEQFRKVITHYENYKKRNEKIDFDDMLYQCYILLITNEKILDLWRRRYSYILIDEFQDINRVQYEIIKLLSLPNNNLFIVGDDDQSIYKFRGARPEFLLHFPQDFENTGRIILNINYRSTKEIVGSSNKVILNNKKRYKKQIETINGVGEKPLFINSEDGEEEALNIAKWINDCIKKGIDLLEIAIIFRTNIQARALVDIMMDLNIPFYLRDEIPNVYDHWIAKDLISYIKLSKDIRDNESLERIINKPKRYISKGIIFEAKKKGGSLFEKLYRFPNIQPWQLEKLEELKYHLARLGRKNPKEAIAYIRKNIDYDGYIYQYAQYRNIGVKGLKEILEEIVEGSKYFDDYKDMLSHIQTIKEEIKEGKKKKIEGKNAVTLSTMHGAKGLEFEAVCIAGAVEGIIPHNKSSSLSELEEERRLFYVGLTRAKSHLTISIIKKRYEEEVKPSRFIEEMGLKTSVNEFSIGTTIIHSKYGRGKIQKLQDGIAYIEFDKGVFSRKIDLKTCIEKDIIFIEKCETK